MGNTDTLLLQILFLLSFLVGEAGRLRRERRYYQEGNAFTKMPRLPPPCVTPCLRLHLHTFVGPTEHWLHSVSRPRREKNLSLLWLLTGLGPSAVNLRTDLRWPLRGQSLPALLDGVNIEPCYLMLVYLKGRVCKWGISHWGGKDNTIN